MASVQLLETILYDPEGTMYNFAFLNSTCHVHMCKHLVPLQFYQGHEAGHAAKYFLTRNTHIYLRLYSLLPFLYISFDDNNQRGCFCWTITATG